MGFKTVYHCLVEVFPQVDVRLLKAVAIENSKDADAAVEVVLTEVLPYLSSRPVVSSLPCHVECYPSGLSDGEAENEEPASVLRHKRAISKKTAGSISETRPTSNEDAFKPDLTCGVHHADSTCQEKALNLPIVLSSNANIEINQLQGNVEREESILHGNLQHLEDNVLSGLSQTSQVKSNVTTHEHNADYSQLYGKNEIEVTASLGECQDRDNPIGQEQQIPQVMPLSLTQEKTDYCGSLIGVHGDQNAIDSPVADDLDMVIGGKSPRVESCSDGTELEVENSVVEQTQHAAEGDHPEVSSSPIDDYDFVGSLHSSKLDLLDAMLEASKDSKKILFCAMESIMNIMRQVELQERAAEQAKEEASKAGLDILVKVEELKKMAALARETNDLHAGEVHGERAILAIEVRELQARMLSLSDERDKALAMLDEMHQALEARLAAAEELRKAAEQEKLEKEESARSELTEQAKIMETIVQESKNLQHFAEENSQLREFLMDHGRVIDTLQGEMSVICQDGRLLKEKFLDECIPLSESVSSSQTTCKLASSGSSLESKSDLVPEPGEASKSPKQTSAPVDGKSPKGKSEEDWVMANGEELLLDDGWDLVKE